METVRGYSGAYLLKVWDLVVHFERLEASYENFPFFN